MCKLFYDTIKPKQLSHSVYTQSKSIQFIEIVFKGTKSVLTKTLDIMIIIVTV